jgi:hypothetical protein
MRKIFSLLLLFTLHFAPLPASAGEALVEGPMEDITDTAAVFTLTVTLLDLGTQEGNALLLTVKLPGGDTMTLEAAGHCRFIDDRRRTLSPSDFAKRYKEKVVTIDFIERGPDLYDVVECRSGTK